MNIIARIKNIEEKFLKDNKDQILMSDEDLTLLIYKEYKRMIAGATIDPQIKDFLEKIIGKKDESM